jgi:PIN domain nuclease of toxin-antitoxin system
MRILLDSHTLVWYLNGNPRCSLGARSAVEDPDATIIVSAVSAWEIATKVRRGKWAEASAIAAGMEAILPANGFEGLSLTIEHGRVAGFLPGAHRDPFDRMLAAQAILENLILITADPAFGNFGVDVLW